MPEILQDINFIKVLNIKIFQYHSLAVSSIGLMTSKSYTGQTDHRLSSTQILTLLGIKTAAR
jgi:hypothetical protein